MKDLLNSVLLTVVCLVTSCSDSDDSRVPVAANAAEQQGNSLDGKRNENMGIDYWTLVEPVWDKISIYDGPERFLLEFGKAPQKSRTLFAAHWAQSEIMNGGLGQFFSNSTGVLAPEAVEAFRELGMPQCASILSESMTFFGETYPRDRAKREENFERYHEENGEDAVLVLEQEDAMAAAIKEENGGFKKAADRYATKGVGGNRR